ncbi:serine/threonine protein kinase [Saprolegnia parasitica CBS 223.65]|uniref:Serine/threonine protein kinase n=1 Tax=Saprolegnia parasitica (strain CBS 223.65) TaxID=695850 RepID=A0A067C3D7_SAPPC|nr:serine/threonine protein kinase [Saprolegnia parasitica CBS 223.65]KDO25274.1 serine/threonine protein kinase [Saprolegnia parasitica CBS 223.65]|eukprot:XP_012203934.1 serine/threonine protein kinase [Saprolegnia parasitica CBS 223.65]
MLPAVGVECDFAQQIGEGATSKVYRGTYTVDGNLLAIKYAREEGQLHGSLKHTNVLRLHRVLPSFPPAFVLEHAKESLHSLVLRVGPLDEATAAQYALQIVHGLEYVHDSNVCHADIKMENVLIGHDGQMRIADFGLSYAHPAPEGFIVGTRGTLFNCAPELWAEEPIVSDKMVDVWALGIVIYEMLTFRHPFSQKPLNPTRRCPFRDPVVCIKTLNYSSDMEPILSKDAKDLLDRIFTLLPGDRISLDDIATHAWMRPRASINTALL